MDGRNAWLRIYWGANWLASDVQSKERVLGQGPHQIFWEGIGFLDWQSEAELSLN